MNLNQIKNTSCMNIFILPEGRVPRSSTNQTYSTTILVVYMVEFKDVYLICRIWNPRLNTHSEEKVEKDLFLLVSGTESRDYVTPPS